MKFSKWYQPKNRRGGRKYEKYIILYDTDDGQKEYICTAEQLAHAKQIVNDFYGENAINTIARA